MATRVAMWLVSIALCLVGIGQLAVAAIIPVKAMAAQVLLERAFDRSVALHQPQKPWPWADMAPIARVSVPRLGIDQIILNAGSGQSMAFGPTLLPTSSRLGEPGTAIIAAHRDTHFKFLEQIRTGDLVNLETLDGTLQTYRVQRTEIVRWDRFAYVANGPVASLALATCYPFGTFAHGPLRYIVYAERVTLADFDEN